MRMVALGAIRTVHNGHLSLLSASGTAPLCSAHILAYPAGILRLTFGFNALVRRRDAPPKPIINKTPPHPRKSSGSSTSGPKDWIASILSVYPPKRCIGATGPHVDAVRLQPLDGIGDGLGVDGVQRDVPETHAGNICVLGGGALRDSAMCTA
ncbi:hypothetical protein FB451DRAFT_1192683 [Mycena latifolia]|nr:hypothetical protein FB451DRAFT_1192683 [Mycena latifolia]